MNGGGPAFPRASTATDKNGVWDGSQEGMSLRDWFAGQALVALGPVYATESQEDIEFPDDWALDAYRIADAMLEERNT